MDTHSVKASHLHLVGEEDRTQGPIAMAARAFVATFETLKLERLSADDETFEDLLAQYDEARDDLIDTFKDVMRLESPA